jgi:hypothetical protein
LAAIYSVSFQFAHHFDPILSMSKSWYDFGLNRSRTLCVFISARETVVSVIKWKILIFKTLPSMARGVQIIMRLKCLLDSGVISIVENVFSPPHSFTDSLIFRSAQCSHNTSTQLAH